MTFKALVGIIQRKSSQGVSIALEMFAHICNFQTQRYTFYVVEKTWKSKRIVDGVGLGFAFVMCGFGYAPDF
jgi:hypothetical protein